MRGLREGTLVVLVTGSRDWAGRDDLRTLCATFRLLPRGSILVHGGARGADRMAGTQWPLIVAGPVISVPYFGYMRRRGGPVRNQFMLDLLTMFEADGHPCEVLAFHHDLEHSAGTGDMVRRAEAVGFRVTVHPNPVT